MNYGKFKGYWVLPGGKVDLGEHPEQAVVREVREETGLDVEVQGLLGVRHRIRPEGQPADVYYVFGAQVRGEPVKLAWPQEELLEARFWKVEEALELQNLRPTSRLMIERARASGSKLVPISGAIDWDPGDSAFG
jgi:ADP-ribose pyrophosphatase YjhB (NUDIX family)